MGPRCFGVGSYSLLGAFQRMLESYSRDFQRTAGFSTHIWLQRLHWRWTLPHHLSQWADGWMFGWMLKDPMVSFTKSRWAITGTMAKIRIHDLTERGHCIICTAAPQQMMLPAAMKKKYWTGYLESDMCHLKLRSLFKDKVMKQNRFSMLFVI